MKPGQIVWQIAWQKLFLLEAVSELKPEISSRPQWSSAGPLPSCARLHYSHLRRQNILLSCFLSHPCILNAAENKEPLVTTVGPEKDLERGD